MKRDHLLDFFRSRLLLEPENDTMARHSGETTAMACRSIIRAAALALTLFPTVVFAHTGVSTTSGFMSGLDHPIFGLDHVLAMTMVGVFACQLGGRALWLLPTTFVLVMAVGGALGAAGFEAPFVEVGIALSVIVLGAIVALDVKASTAVAMGVVGLFAILHGHAHGAEMPQGAGGLTYTAGFMIATAALHIVGISLGLLIGKFGEQLGSVAVRASGGVAAAAGVGILTGIL
jgi:urease accessory protein